MERKDTQKITIKLDTCSSRIKENEHTRKKNDIFLEITTSITGCTYAYGFSCDQASKSTKEKKNCTRKKEKNYYGRNTPIRNFM